MSYDRPQELLKPVKRRFITLTFALALMMELLPLPVGSTRWLPDFVGLLILYWAINQPRRIGIGMGFLIGLVVDVSTNSLFGQHALAYSVTTYLVMLRQRQLVMFNLGPASPGGADPDAGEPADHGAGSPGAGLGLCRRRLLPAPADGRTAVAAANQAAAAALPPPHPLSMHRPTRLKDAQAEESQFQLRLVIAYGFMVLMLLTLAARFIWLQVMQYEHFATLAQNNSISLVPVQPNRGLIMDRNGVVLAQNHAGLYAGNHPGQNWTTWRPRSRRWAAW